MERTDMAPEGFLASFDDDVAPTMLELDAIIRSALPGRSRTVDAGRFWGGTEQRILGYGSIVQPRPRGGTVHGAYLLTRFADRLGKVKTGSASIGFRSLEDVDREELAAPLRRAHALTPADAEIGPDPTPT